MLEGRGTGGRPTARWLFQRVASADNVRGTLRAIYTTPARVDDELVADILRPAQVRSPPASNPVCFCWTAARAPGINGKPLGIQFVVGVLGGLVLEFII